MATALSLPGKAAEGAPAVQTDADLAKEADSATASKNVDVGTGKTLQERIRAVSRRSFLKAGRFELTPHSGFSLSDPFIRSWVVGARGAWHFTEEFALDFGGAYAFFPQQLDIFRVLNVPDEEVAEDIEAKFGTNKLVAYFDAGVTFSPFYGKVALASELVGHFDIFVSAGAAGVVDGGGFYPGLELGLGSRLYLTRWLAARVDVRNYAYADTGGANVQLGNLTVLNFGLAFYLPLDFDYAAETLGAKD
ncbi:MAG TPA: outer membrane beta-barrel domain-containing protein [Myxococcota bacterium]